ncbi:50S ribosomal protein L18-like [Quillaja saponaria]|uniref:50S ribosomal protein L18-like n=1 Tax=Quillaja saponaria TaxID=32244 RepID=A0AAD7KP84_QUISA|nr:50S ribosomal protein L18-like [Quillaja saponaria]
MSFVNGPALQFKNSAVFGIHSKSFISFPMQNTSITRKPLVIEARANARKESAKIRNRRMQKKFNGTPTSPRLSVFCSDKQLYAMLVDDQNKKCLFYGSTLQKSIRQNPKHTTTEAAEHVGESLVRACIDLNINEISFYDRNGFARGERMQAFENAISRYGFLPR